MTDTARYADPEGVLRGIAGGDPSTLERSAAVRLDTLAGSGLDGSSYVLVRLAALAAMGAAPHSYLSSLDGAGARGIGAEQMRGVLVAIAPLVGGVRITEAAASMLQALGAGGPAGGTGGLEEL